VTRPSLTLTSDRLEYQCVCLPVCMCHRLQQNLLSALFS
jgi:hypothetical protein